jgi:Choice-of-anchor I domain
MRAKLTRVCSLIGILASTWLATASFALDPPCNTDFLAPEAAVRLEILASIRHPLQPNVCKKSSASSVAYDPASRRLFVTNPFDAVLEIYNASDPSNPTLIERRLLGSYSGNCDPNNPLHCSRPNHVAVADGVVAVAVINDPATDPGRLVLLDTDGVIRHELVVGPNPTWVAITPDGEKIVVVSQGVPSSDYLADPEGSIAIVDGWRSPTPKLTPITLQSFNDRKNELIAQGVRIYGPCRSASPQPCEVTVAQDLEPVSLVISGDSERAWVTFETNNALGLLDIKQGRMTDIRSFGLKDHNKWGNRLDATIDNDFDLRPWPVNGMYQPNGIDLLRTHGQTYLITANRGNWRETSVFVEQTTVAEACSAGWLDAHLCYDTLINGFEGLAAGIPDLKIARYPYRYDADPNARLSAPFTYGGRSFAIWTPAGGLVHDSGTALEAITYRAVLHISTHSPTRTPSMTEATIRDQNQKV